MKPTLYLAGAINGMSDEEANGWRTEAKAALGELYNILDPMARDYRGAEAKNVDEIVHGDLADIEASHVLLIRADRPSWGTGAEVPLAFYAGKRNIAWGVGERVSPWLLYHTAAVVPTLADAIALLRAQHDSIVREMAQ